MIVFSTFLIIQVQRTRFYGLYSRNFYYKFFLSFEKQQNLLMTKFSTQEITIYSWHRLYDFKCLKNTCWKRLRVASTNILSTQH